MLYMHVDVKCIKLIYSFYIKGQISITKGVKIMDFPECAICYDVNSSPLIHKWTCKHDEKFHTVCIENWNNGCPLCRNTELLEKYRSSIVTYTKRCLSREYLLHPDYRVNEPYKSVYMEKWSKRLCIENSHDLLFKRPGGVIGWCQNCDITQCFNLSHPIN
jgi:hypothetical protein